MPNPSYVASQNSGAGDTFANTKAIAVPAGAVAGMLMEITAETWTSGTEPTVSNWVGFTEVTGAHAVIATTGTAGFQSVRKAWKRLTAGDVTAGTFTVTFSATCWNKLVSMLGTDVLASGDPVDAANTATGTTGYPNAAVTTTGAALVSNGAATFQAVTSTPPTGYTERQDANVLRLNTQEVAAAGAVAGSGGTVTTNGEICVATVAYKGTAVSGLGAAAETDAGQPVGHIRATTAPVATETDAAQAVGRIRATTVGTAAEVDAAQAISSIRTTTAAVAAETDTGQPVGRTRTTTLGTAVEAELALGPGGGGGTPAGAATEIDAGQPVGRIRTTAVPPSAETDTAQPVGRIRTTSLGAAIETDQGQPTGSTRTTLLGPALETDTGQAVTGPNPPASNFRLAGRVESPWQAAVEPGRYAVEVEA